MGDSVDTSDDDGHVHTNKTVDAVASTCTQAGLTEGVVCTSCNKTVVAQTATTLAPHDYVDGKCKVCGTTAKESTGLGKINNDVFFECYSLEVVDITSKIASVGGWAFYDC